MTDYYKILDIPKNASLNEVKSAFRRLARQYHPDVSPLPNARELFVEINEAYNYIINKILIENELKEKNESKYKETAQEIIDAWIISEKNRIREKANKYAGYKFARFKLTKIYRTTEFLTKWISLGTLMFGIIVFIFSGISTINYLIKARKIDILYVISSSIIILLGLLITIYSAYKFHEIYKLKRKHL